MRWAIFCIFVISSLLPLHVSATELQVGIYNNPPLSFLDPNDQPSGLFPELLEQLAETQDWQLNYKECSWHQCLDLLEAGTIDLLPAIAYTEQRAQQYRFSEETILTSWGQVYQRPDDEPIDSIFQLAGRRLAVLENDVYYGSEQGLRQMAKSFGVNIDFIVTTSYQEAFRQLAAGEVDAALVGRLYGIKHRQQFGLLPTPLVYKPIQVRVAFSLASPAQLQQQFDDQLGNWKRSTGSSYFQLLDKWLGNTAEATFPGWLKGLLLLLGVGSCLLLASNFWARHQVKIKTVQLEEKNRQLEDELIERQAVESELLERQRQYQVLFEENQVSILLIDPQTTKVVDANPAACEFYQYPRETLQKMGIGELNELNQEQIQEKVEQIKMRQLKSFELPHRLASGEVRLVEIQSSPIVVEGRQLICSIIHDISQRKKAEQELAERNDFLQSVIDGVSDPLMVIDFNYQVLQMNEAAAEQLTPGQTTQQQLSCHLVSHASAVPCSGEDHPCPLREVKETGQPVTVVHNHIDGQRLRIVEVNASPLYSREGELYAVIEVARDITERQQIEELLSENEKRLHHLAHHDPLTDLPNRLLFEDRLKQALSKARRSRKQVALFFLDLDHFKDINDNLGHDFGDQLLVDIASRLRNCIRESDTVARLGGDEFLVLLEEIDSFDMIEQMAERICQALTHELSHDNYRQRVSASIGISVYPDDGGTGQELLRSADQAMYRAKGKGKATYQFASNPQAIFNFDS